MNHFNFFAVFVNVTIYFNSLYLLLFALTSAADDDVIKQCKYLTWTYKLPYADRSEKFLWIAMFYLFLVTEAIKYELKIKS